ncbi:MAG: MarC family protein [Bdellovibrionota bacterium]
MPDFSDHIKIIVGLLAIVNPPSVVPVFLQLTEGQGEFRRHRFAFVAGMTVAGVLVVAALVGRYILEGLGIGTDSFKVGGGILLLMTAIAMMQGELSKSKQSPEEAVEAGAKDEVAVVPLGIPLLAGPGAITTVILNSEQAGSAQQIAVLYGGIVLVALATWGTLRLAGKMQEILGRTGINIIGRVMGLLLAAIAIEFIAKGLAALLPGLG